VTSDLYRNGIDVSKWDGGGFPYVTLEWDRYAWGYAFIKASEGTVIDPLFARQWEEARGRTVRGAYHYFRASVDPKQAVEKLLYFLDSDLGELPAALDLENLDGMPTATVRDRAKTWLEEFRRLTGIRALIYSSPYFMRDVLQAGSATWLAEYPLWLAQYPFDNMSEPARSTKIHEVLTGVSTVTFPVPPAPFTRAPFWQWTAKGNPADVPGYYMGPGRKLSVDLNFYNGTRDQFLIEFGTNPGGTLPTPPIPPAGSIRRFGSNCWVRFVGAAQRVHVTNLNGGLETVLSAAQRLNTQIAVNGDAWVTTMSRNIPISLAKSDGNFYQSTQYDLRPYLGVKPDGGFVITHDRRRATEFHDIVSGVRYLVQAGEKKSYLSGTAAQYVEKHPRTAFFLTGDGRLGIVVVDGRSTTSAGVTLAQLADIMLEYGAITGIDGDGGGSTALAENGALIDQPSETRAVVNHLIVFGDPLGQGETIMYQMTTISDGTRVRDQHNTAGNVLTSVPANTVVTGNELFIATVQISNSNGVYQFVGDQWLKVTVNGQTGWMAYIHKGQPICRDFQEITEPAPTERPSYLTAHYDDGSTERFNRAQ